MWRVFVRSRSGNLLLGAIGALYAVSSVAVLVWFVVDVWEAAGLVDVMLQIALLAAAACGLWFVYVARENLALRDGARQSDREASNPASIQR